VGELARKLTDDFNAGVWGYLAGLWHDVRRLWDRWSTTHIRKTVCFRRACMTWG